jgi:hypothetical protein
MKKNELNRLLQNLFEYSSFENVKDTVINLNDALSEKIMGGVRINNSVCNHSRNSGCANGSCSSTVDSSCQNYACG